MTLSLCRQPQLLGLLEVAKLRLDEDGPRMILADWLEDHGESERAEFIRHQCRIASRGTLQPQQRRLLTERCRQLVDHQGGCWLGPLWRWCPSAVNWHRGLLSLQLPRRYDPEVVRMMLPWIDTLIVDVRGKAGLHQAIELLAGSGVNHVHLDLSHALRESSLQEALGSLSPSQALRTLAFDWPLRLLRPTSDGESCEPTISPDFLCWLLEECSAGQHLTHLGSSCPFNQEQTEVIRRHGIQPVTFRHRFWTQRLAPTCFQPPNTPSFRRSTCPPV